MRILNFLKGLNAKFLKLSKPKKIIVVVIVVAIVFSFYHFTSSSKDNGYIFEKVKRADIVEMVSETGNISVAGKTDIYSPSDGIIEEIYVQNGDFVVKDQELFKVKSTATSQEQQAAYSNYLTAKTTLDAANATAYSLRSSMYSKWKDFLDMATSSNYENDDQSPKESERLSAAEFQQSQDDWNNAELNYKNQQSVIAQAQASVASTWLLYQATQNSVTYAVTDGTVTNLTVGEGDGIKANVSPVVTVSPVLSIANLSKYTVKITLSESDIYKVKPGQPVALRVDSFKSKKYEGVVERVDSIGTDINGVVKYNVYVDIKNPDEKLKFGMTIDTDITTKKQVDVLAVPNSAIKPYMNGKAVRVLNRATKEVEYLPVEIGIKGSKYTEIIKGLKEGQEIITSLKNEQVKRQSPFGF